MSLLPDDIIVSTPAALSFEERKTLFSVKHKPFLPAYHLQAGDYVGKDGNTYNSDHWQVDENDELLYDADGNPIPDPDFATSAALPALPDDSDSLPDTSGTDNSASLPDTSGNLGGGDSGSGDSGGGGDSYTPPAATLPIVPVATTTTTLPTAPLSGPASILSGLKTLGSLHTALPGSGTSIGSGGGGSGSGSSSIGISLPASSGIVSNRQLPGGRSQSRSSGTMANKGGRTIFRGLPRIR